jgi:membrane protease YdiL (CAAX protease family)
MHTSPRWPIGSTGALGLAFLLIVGHYLACLPGGLLAIVLGVERRQDIWLASPAAFAVVITVAAVEIGVILRLAMRHARLSFRDVGWHGFAPRDLALGVLGFALHAITLTCILSADAGFTDAITYIADKIAHYTPQQRVFFAMMGVIAAFPEETIFRGLMQPTLQAKLGRWAGVVVTAVVFDLYHFMFAWPQLVGHLVHGLILGVLRKRTGTLWAPAIAHALMWIVFGAI